MSNRAFTLIELVVILVVIGVIIIITSSVIKATSVYYEISKAKTKTESVKNELMIKYAKNGGLEHNYINNIKAKYPNIEIKIQSNFYFSSNQYLCYMPFAALGDLEVDEKGVPYIFSVSYYKSSDKTGDPVYTSYAPYYDLKKYSNCGSNKMGYAELVTEYMPDYKVNEPYSFTLDIRSDAPYVGVCIEFVVNKNPEGYFKSHFPENINITKNCVSKYTSSQYKLYSKAKVYDKLYFSGVEDEIKDLFDYNKEVTMRVHYFPMLMNLSDNQWVAMFMKSKRGMIKEYKIKRID